ncbi:S-layer homology domain-containing protein [Neomoorella thermoacetica]|uniref:S-layer homology domain-containing protein n=1 Tax=Neomoorella thermoacetica TaxID=1525 RepID=UPI0008FAF825|nr:S-layer homology domain-containing protein [Moorella thermoacetica]APC07371.1 endo-1,4-beta-xylanase A precursor [Moorella thermoacetica]OIQ53301.1 endo-1,4-beta-xylanase A precursor [Moorella thermoacetica]
MRIKGLWSYLAVVVCLSLVLAGIPAMPTAAAASSDPVADLVNRLQPVYNCLDAGDKAVIQAAKDEIAGLSDDEIANILVAKQLITNGVKSRLGIPDDPNSNNDENEAALKLAPVIRAAAQIQYAQDTTDLERNINDFRTNPYNSDVFSKLFPGVNVDDAWQFALDTETNLPAALQSNLGNILEQFIAGSSYDAVLNSFSDIISDAASGVNSDFKDALTGLSWNIGLLMQVKDALRDNSNVPNGKAAEQALLKGYIRSQTQPLGSTTLTVGSTQEYGLKVLNQFEVSSSIASVLGWQSSDPSIASFNGNKLTAHKAGTIKVRAYHPSAGTNPDFNNSLWLAEFQVTVNAASGGGGGGGGASQPGQSTSTTTDFGQVTVDKSTGSVTTTIDAAKAADLIAQASGPVVFKADIPTDVTVKTATMELPAAVFTKAAEAGKALSLEVAGVKALLPAGVIPSEILADPAATVNFAFQVLDTTEAQAVTGNLPASMRQAADVIEIDLYTVKGDNQQMVTPAKPVTLTLTYRPEGVDADKLGVYRYNVAAGTWEYKGGRVDKATNSISAVLNSFSKYTVLAYDKTFSDIQGHWAQRDIEIMAARHVAAGISASEFKPEGQVTRAEFTAFLLRTLGISEDRSVANRFADIQPGDWYYGAVVTASRTGLVAGYEDGSFRPDKAISRQEMAAMLARALTYAGQKVDVAGRVDDILSKFSDNGSFASWARESAAVAVESGLIVGRTATTFVPLGNATRAETVVMLKRLQDRI